MLQADQNLDGHLGSLNAELANFELAGFHHYETRTRTRRMSWKLLVDTFIESYHLWARQEGQRRPAKLRLRP